MNIRFAQVTGYMSFVACLFVPAYASVAQTPEAQLATLTDLQFIEGSWKVTGWRSNPDRCFLLQSKWL